MTISPRLSRRTLLRVSGVGAGAALLGACGDDDSGSSSGTIDWWHISNTAPMLDIWAQAAKDYEAAHSGTKINVTPLENEAFKAKLLTVTQAGKPPSLFHSWGGGALAQQVEAGLVKELSGDTGWVSDVNANGAKIYQVNGKQYGIPFDLGLVGFWYNKEHFAKANITAPPKTWAEFLEIVGKLKSANLVPIALAGAEKWPGHFYWSYLAIRQAGVAGLQAAAKDGSFDQQDFITAGEKLKQLVDLKPFQNGWQAAKYSSTDGQAAIVGNGQASMELMGQFAPANQAAFSTSKTGLGDKLGFFPFPALDGGKGSPTEVFGGANGFAIGKDASKETQDFVKYLLSVDVQRKAAASGAIIPVTKGAEDAIKDPNMKQVYETVSKATAFQLYLDQAFKPTVGQQVNDSVAELMDGKATPKQVADAIAKTAKTK